MAKRRNPPPARKAREAQGEEHSLLIRSAESLGRVIGVLQRQLDDASRRMGSANGGSNGRRVDGRGSNGTGSKRKVAKKKTATKRKRTTH
jgi:hypothetical protein